MGLKHKDLVSINQLTSDEITLILDMAESFREVSERPIKKVPTLRGRTVITLFFEPSTRTRISFELAAKRLSADTVNISKSTSAVVKGESIKDTAQTIQAMAADLVVIRHAASGSAALLAKYMQCSVVNAGDGAHEHPTQALLDLFTIRQAFGTLNGVKVAVVGDILHSRVAGSNILALKKMGAEVTVVGPPTLIPKGVESLGVKVSHDLDTVLPEVDVLYLLRIQLERQGEPLFPSLREYATLFGLNKKRLQAAKPDLIVMHPGPINRGVEIASEVADMPQSVITTQVTNGVAVRMAVLYLLLGGAGSDE
ncbi:MAG: aspartate carbamoyltransferase [Candidatus Aquicultor secundus]|uniref:Aspartate carbamoyltransferase n=1 Tax=Candidatus Aquicultor secundus TaxID=1973895 RepID=A0A2M7T5B5_9ACTN|nr:aspartate carbamoyltransferase catalytic subunit [Candidatus Aquicultor secundus]NCO65859.1 aspartate carbamoyltransferase catalytic subunit [Solirubrobacter sp.]OIO86395.1 MAG: aspartate carbamoyltransferase [Candidatus Aquicultor secundus]PIU26354.1 MAG: aspartate carbamoyltransferase [Candidatus Aquicultor secundus]PIW22240.1 MAG: aspartate carbamoyltransferase [Candidatus Aquicultor secundus]PIX52831.1 MAG: aspartate carbamoyltransferase [Candidatus Aquicultor secundus]